MAQGSFPISPRNQNRENAPSSLLPQFGQQNHPRRPSQFQFLSPFSRGGANIIKTPSNSSRSRMPAVPGLGKPRRSQVKSSSGHQTNKAGALQMREKLNYRVQMVLN